MHPHTVQTYRVSGLHSGQSYLFSVCPSRQNCQNQERMSTFAEHSHSSYLQGHLLTCIIGLLMSITPAVLQAPLHYRGLQHLRSRALQQSNPQNTDYDTTVLLSQEAQRDLTWWIEHSFRER